MEGIVWKCRANAILGLLVVLLVFLGVPNTLRSTLFVVCGLLIAVFGAAGSRLPRAEEHERSH